MPLWQEQLYLLPQGCKCDQKILLICKIAYLSKQFSSELVPVWARIILDEDPVWSLEVDGSCLNIIKSLVLRFALLLASLSVTALSARFALAHLLLATLDTGKTPSNGALEICLLPNKSASLKDLFLFADVITMPDTAASVAAAIELGVNKSSLTSTRFAASLFVYVLRSPVVGKTVSRRSTLQHNKIKC